MADSIGDNGIHFYSQRGLYHCTAFERSLVTKDSWKKRRLYFLLFGHFGENTVYAQPQYFRLPTSSSLPESCGQSVFKLIFANMNHAEGSHTSCHMLVFHSVLRVGYSWQEQDIHNGHAALSLKKYQYPHREPYSAAVYISSPGRTKAAAKQEQRTNSIRERPSSSDFSYLPPHKCAHLNVSHN